MDKEFTEFIGGLPVADIDEVNAFGLQMMFIGRMKDKMYILGYNNRKMASLLDISNHRFDQICYHNILLTLSQIAKIGRLLGIYPEFHFNDEEEK